MNLEPLVAQVKALSVDDRLELMHLIWDSLDADQAAVDLTEEQKRELDRRLAANTANPEKVIPWEEVKARSLARARAQS
ncbi:MAG: addiction module protein [Planctomycetia bacterium]|nr:addiction module protein [Planctomycetia bacterium]